MNGGTDPDGAGRVPAPARPRAAWLAPAAVAALAAAVALWPMLAGMVAANDDLKFVRGAALERGLWPAIAEAWRTSPAFRPLELAVGASCDPVGLGPGIAPAVQAAGLAALLLGTAALARRVAPAFPAAGTVAQALVLLSPGTTSALWQVDAASQTWSGALGAWAIVIAIDAWRAAPAGIARSTLALGAVFALGCTVKETFYGWSLAVGGALAVALAARAWRGGGGMAARAWLLVPAVLVPAAHLALRAATGALGSSAAGEAGDRYAAELGINVLVNAGMAVAGSLANGPFHAVTDDAAPVAVRALPLVSALAAFGAVAAAWLLALPHRGQGGITRLAPSAACAAAGVASLAAVLPMGSVSELYCLGPNACVAVALAASLCALWSPQAADEQLIGRSAAVAAGGALALVGAFGLAGRAYHHRLTWEYARLVNGILLRHVETVPPEDPSSGRAAFVVYIAGPCFLGRTYGQYVIPPAQAIGMDDTGPWLLRRDPSRGPVFTVNVPTSAPPPSDLVLDCAAFPQREHW